MFSQLSEGCPMMGILLHKQPILGAFKMFVLADTISCKKTLWELEMGEMVFSPFPRLRAAGGYFGSQNHFEESDFPLLLPHPPQKKLMAVQLTT